RQIRIAPPAQLHRRRQLLHLLLQTLDHLRIAVDGQNPAFGTDSFGQSPQMATAAGRRIDNKLPRLEFKCRQYLIEHYGNVERHKRADDGSPIRELGRRTVVPSIATSCRGSERRWRRKEESIDWILLGHFRAPE